MPSQDDLGQGPACSGSAVAHACSGSGSGSALDHACSASGSGSASEEAAAMTQIILTMHAGIGHSTLTFKIERQPMSRRIHVVRVKSDPCRAAPVLCRVNSGPCPCLACRALSDCGVSSCPPAPPRSVRTCRALSGSLVSSVQPTPGRAVLGRVLRSSRTCAPRSPS